MTLCPRTIRKAAQAWIRAHRHVTDHEGVGMFEGETADEIIERKVRRVDDPALWRRYETAVKRLGWHSLKILAAGVALGGLVRGEWDVATFGLTGLVWCEVMAWTRV